MDLLIHALAGYAATAGVGLGPLRFSPVAAFMVGASAGVAKELYDSRPGGTGFNGKDLLATLAGAGAAGVQLRWDW